MALLEEMYTNSRTIVAYSSIIVFIVSFLLLYRFYLIVS